MSGSLWACDLEVGEEVRSILIGKVLDVGAGEDAGGDGGINCDKGLVVDEGEMTVVVGSSLVLSGG